MSHHTYFYCRVSTTEQTTANQVQTFKDKGYNVTEEFVIEETNSGSECAMEPKGFRAMVEHKLMKGSNSEVIVFRL
jgi:putative DNA-invertase from lambdoid prophage Rac